MCRDSCGRLKDRPSKDISDETAEISLICASLRTTSHRINASGRRPVGDAHCVRKQGCKVV